jgi:DNA replication initiation complex subunit (GINS family)
VPSSEKKIWPTFKGPILFTLYRCAASIGQPVQDSQNRTARTGQPEQDEPEQDEPEQDSLSTRTAEHGSQSRKTRPGYQGRIPEENARIRQPARTGQPGLDSQDRLSRQDRGQDRQNNVTTMTDKAARIWKPG